MKIEHNMNTPKVKTVIRQDQIMKAAINLLAEHGSRGVTIARIANRLGIVPSAIYRHYKNKDQIYEAMIDYIGAQLQENVKRTQEIQQDPVQQLHGVLQKHIHFIRENQSIPRIIFSGELYKNNAKHRARLYRMIQLYLDEIAILIKRGQTQCQIRQTIDPHAAAIFFLGIVQPATILWDLSNGEYDVTKQSERIWLLYETMLIQG